MSRLLHDAKVPIVAVFAVLVIGLLLVYGTPEAEAEIAAAQTTTSTPAVTPSPQPSATPAAISNESCINCHTNQEQLKATAKEEVVVENLSEGEG
jgi:hypothetical protein